MTSLPVIRIGTRKSPLALAQAEMVAARLRACWPQTQTEIVTFTTSGDQFLDRPLSEIGGKGLFTKEIEEALLAKDIHIAVHSMKDMPTVLPEGLMIGAMLEREDVRDMLVGPSIDSIDSLPQGATIGTSSLRRTALLKVRRPDLNIVPLRGNVQTRLAKLKEGGMQATMLAKAGLNRLGMHDLEGAVLPVEDFLPAVGQGAIGIECREGDEDVRLAIAAIAHELTKYAVICERAFLRVLDGSCRTPIGGYAHIEHGQILFNGIIAKPDGSVSHTASAFGDFMDAEEVGKRAGEDLLIKSGGSFLP